MVNAGQNDGYSQNRYAVKNDIAASHDCINLHIIYLRSGIESDYCELLEDFFFKLPFCWEETIFNNEVVSQCANSCLI